MAQTEHVALRTLIHDPSYDNCAQLLVGLQRADEELRYLHESIAVTPDLEHFPRISTTVRRATGSGYHVDFSIESDGIHLVQLLPDTAPSQSVGLKGAA